LGLKRNAAYEKMLTQLASDWHFSGRLGLLLGIEQASSGL
jgi:hypothetical protein